MKLVLVCSLLLVAALGHGHDHDDHHGHDHTSRSHAHHDHGHGDSTPAEDHHAHGHDCGHDHGQKHGAKVDERKLSEEEWSEVWARGFGYTAIITLGGNAFILLFMSAPLTGDFLKVCVFCVCL